MSEFPGSCTPCSTPPAVGARRCRLAGAPRRYRVPRRLHLGFTVSTAAELERQRDCALARGARILLDRTDEPDVPEEPL